MKVRKTRQGFERERNIGEKGESLHRRKKLGGKRDGEREGIRRRRGPKEKMS